VCGRIGRQAVQPTRFAGHGAEVSWLDGSSSLSGHLGRAAAPGQASVYLVHASQHILRGVPDVKRAMLEGEHVQRGDSRVYDAHVMSAGFATMCQTRHPQASVRAASSSISNYTGC
jgi:hypothetical protein